MADEPTPQPAEPTTTEPAPEPVKEPEPALKDSHGQPAISKGKYERDMAKMQAEVDALKAQLEEKAKSEEGREELARKVESLQTELKETNLSHELQMAGCVNEKAAKAVLSDYDSVASMKEACPYLFNQPKPPTGSTGLKPGGAPTDAEALRAKARKAAGLKP